MSKRLLPPEIRTASVVPRWSILWTLTRDTVSNHSFFVTFYTRQIATMIEWNPYPEALGDLMYLALTHDLDETVTGDIVSPVKREIIDNERAADYVEAKMRERLQTVLDVCLEIEERRSNGVIDEIWRIVKAADRLDALLFLTVERRLGNGVISPQITPMWNMLEAAWFALPAKKPKLELLWNTAIVPAVHEHETTGGFGI